MAAGEADFNLERFLQAQDEAGSYERALGELARGKKRSHWIWFVFPQLAGLGQSPAARHFAISSLAEAKAYLAHEELSHRLEAACRALLGLERADAVSVLGALDATKVASSMTLFMRADPSRAVFSEVLDRYYGGRPDPLTDELLSGRSPA